MQIQVAAVLFESIVDGPGIRTAVFVQGCPHNCPGCHNPSTHSFTGGMPMSIAQILCGMQRDKLVSGLTLTGGEPFCQAMACAGLAQAAKKAGYNVLSYSGYTYEELLSRAEQDPGVAALLNASDWLIDGPYREAERSLELRFRGSGNQRVIDLAQTRQTGGLVTLSWDNKETADS